MDPCGHARGAEASDGSVGPRASGARGLRRLPRPPMARPPFVPPFRAADFHIPAGLVVFMVFFFFFLSEVPERKVLFSVISLVSSLSPGFVY